MLEPDVCFWTLGWLIMPRTTSRLEYFLIGAGSFFTENKGTPCLKCRLHLEYRCSLLVPAGFFSVAAVKMEVK